MMSTQPGDLDLALDALDWGSRKAESGARMLLEEMMKASLFVDWVEGKNGEEWVSVSLPPFKIMVHRDDMRPAEHTTLDDDGVILEGKARLKFVGW
jgi:hypothetical protein